MARPTPAPHDDPLHAPLGFMLVRIAEAIDRRFVARLAPLQLRPRHLHVLRYLGAYAPISQQELAAGIGVDPGNVIETLDELQARRLITREVDSGDRRRRRIGLTATGRSRLARGVQAAERAEQEILATLSGPELAVLNELAQRVYGELMHS
jgi:DNA-binding MarR family transcriptional regulator